MNKCRPVHPSMSRVEEGGRGGKETGEDDGGGRPIPILNPVEEGHCATLTGVRWTTSWLLGWPARN